MNLRLCLLASCTLLLGAVQPGRAADAVHLSSIEGRTEPGSRLPAVFGNHAETLDLDVTTAPIPSASLRADLLQVAGTLAMPLTKDVHLQEGIVILNQLPQHLRVSIKFPEVKEHAEILVRLTLVPNVPQAAPISLGDLRFEVFPASLSKDLTDLLQSKPGETEPVIVFGPGQKLRHFLTGQHVTFEDGGLEIPDRFDPRRLYFGELSDDKQFQQAQDRSAGGRMALFSSDETLPDGIYADRSTSGVLVHVTSPLLDNLDHDPRAQLGLIKIIHFLAASPTSNP